MPDLDQAIRERHSTRMFLPRPVPRELVQVALIAALLHGKADRADRGAIE